MPVSKNQWLRLQSILGLMRKKTYVNYRIFNEEISPALSCGKVSARTFSRDITALIQIGAPLEYCAKHRGYFLAELDWKNNDLPTVQGDFKLLLLSEKVSHSFMPPQLRGELSNAVNALLMKQEDALPEGMDLENFQILNPEFAPKVDPEVFLEVYQAWENKKLLKFSYISSKGHQSVKVIEPHILAWNDGIWYIKGLVANEDGVPCELPLSVRVFAMHRIGNAKNIGKAFTTDEEDRKPLKQNSLFAFECLPEVEIEFFQPYVKQIKERFFSQPESIIAETENSITIRLTNIPEYAATKLIFLAMGNVHVIKPASLRETIRKTGEAIIKNMS